MSRNGADDTPAPERVDQPELVVALRNTALQLESHVREVGNIASNLNRIASACARFGLDDQYRGGLSVELGCLEEQFSGMADRVRELKEIVKP